MASARWRPARRVPPTDRCQADGSVRDASARGRGAAGPARLSPARASCDRARPARWSRRSGAAPDRGRAARFRARPSPVRRRIGVDRAFALGLCASALSARSTLDLRLAARARPARPDSAAASSSSRRPSSRSASTSVSLARAASRRASAASASTFSSRARSISARSDSTSSRNGSSSDRRRSLARRSSASSCRIAWSSRRSDAAYASAWDRRWRLGRSSPPSRRRSGIAMSVATVSSSSSSGPLSRVPVKRRGPRACRPRQTTACARGRRAGDMDARRTRTSASDGRTAVRAPRTSGRSARGGPPPSARDARARMQTVPDAPDRGSSACAITAQATRIRYAMSGRFQPAAPPRRTRAARDFLRAPLLR